MSENIEDITSMLFDILGPDLEAIERFTNKEGLKFNGISTRISDIENLLSEVAKIDNFENPQELTTHLQTVFSSIDSILKFVTDIKNRLLLLNQEIDRRSPKMFGGFFRSKESQKPINLDIIKYDTDNLMELYGINKK